MTDFLEIKPAEINKATIKEINGLSEGLKTKGIKAATREAAKPILAAMKASAPDDPRTPGSRLKQAMNITPVTSRTVINTVKGPSPLSVPPETATFIVGPNKKRFTKNKVRHRIEGAAGLAIMLEGGVKAHTIGSVFQRMRVGSNWVRGPIRHPGIRPRRFMAGSIESGGRKMQDAFFNRLSKFLETGK